jgi:pimeloyl-ACP methyl ester carboxylesterase
MTIGLARSTETRTGQALFVASLLRFRGTPWRRLGRGLCTRRGGRSVCFAHLLSHTNHRPVRPSNQTVEKALQDNGRKIHLVGHSLGGVIARSLAAQRPKDVASVISSASPIRGTVANRAIAWMPGAHWLPALQLHQVKIGCEKARNDVCGRDSAAPCHPRLHLLIGVERQLRPRGRGCGSHPARADASIHATEAVRLRILQEHGQGVLPQCYTGRCTCNFVDSLR